MTKADIQLVRSLRDKSARDALGLFVIEGPKVVSELLAARFRFEAIYALASWETNAPGASVQHVTEAEMSRISQLPTPSPVLAIARIQRPALAPGALDRGWTLALDGIQDPGNVGTLLRIADWFGIDRVLLSPTSADVFSSKVIGASMGSFARITTYIVELAATLSDAKVPILGCDLEGDDVHTVKPLKDVIIVIGSEGQGLSGELRGILSRRVTIPRYGSAESLNAAVAAAVVCDCLRSAPRG